MTKVVSTRLSETEHKKLLDKCNTKGCTQADLLKDIVIDFLNGENAGSIEAFKEDAPVSKPIVNQIDNKPIPKATKVTITAIKRKPARIYRTQERLG